MAIGPVQLLVFGFEKPEFTGEIAAELVRLRDNGIIRLIDGVVVNKDANGDVETLQASDLSLEEAEEFGATVGALIGLGVAGEEGFVEGAEAGAEAMAERDGHALGDPDEWYVVDEIPPDTAAVVLMIEHTWAIPLRDMIVAKGGIPLGDAWIRPLDLIELGVITGAEAEAQMTA
jgi:uncharacterized membrane protein